MTGEVWSLVSCCSRKQCDGTRISESAKIASQGVLVHSSLPMGSGVRKITCLLRAYLALSKLALNAHEIIKGMRTGKQCRKKGNGSRNLKFQVPL